VKGPEWDARYRSADLVWGKAPNQFVREQCEGLAPAEALDIACGEGRNALWLAQLGWRVHGVDISPVAVERAEQLTGVLDPDVQARLSWAVADVTEQPPAPASADLVLLSYVQLPSAERRALVEAAARAVRPGGRLLLVAHDARNLTEGIGGPQDVDLLYRPEEVAAQAEAAGLTVETASTVPRATAEGTALDALVRAQRPPLGLASGSEPSRPGGSGEGQPRE
jgi:SAM-dependent methyltransferase